MPAIPSAQYLRMSTEHQQYSLDNQAAAIAVYAERHGFSIVRTYSDAAKSGVLLKRRAGLRQLLQDVTSESVPFRVVLVYDVSRWGRFQDTDEAAHYEFVCKSAGVPVHYCAETFVNDGSLPSLIMKSLKRAMAGEYSRELGVKILAGQHRLARLGFKQGGLPGYGLRRMLVSQSGERKQLLASGERKSIATDRVILVPGPEHEVETVREIYRMLIDEGRTVHAITVELNRRGIRCPPTGKWSYDAVHKIVSHPKYAGMHVFGRTSSRLYTPSVPRPKSQWILKRGAYEPLVSEARYLQAQAVLAARTIEKTDDELLDRLRQLRCTEERLCLRNIHTARDVPSPSTYVKRFGSLRRAYELIGYGQPEDFGPIDLRRRTQALREALMTHIADAFPHDLTITRRGGRWRSTLLVQNQAVSVVVARCSLFHGRSRWIIDPNKREWEAITVLARLDESNSAVRTLQVFPRLKTDARFIVGSHDPWLRAGVRLTGLKLFLEIVQAMQAIRCTVR